jgi:hypothetical protein
MEKRKITRIIAVREGNQVKMGLLKLQLVTLRAR